MQTAEPENGMSTHGPTEPGGRPFVRRDVVAVPNVAVGDRVRFRDEQGRGFPAW